MLRVKSSFASRQVGEEIKDILEPGNYYDVQSGSVVCITEVVLAPYTAPGQQPAQAIIRFYGTAKETGMILSKVLYYGQASFDHWFEALET